MTDFYTRIQRRASSIKFTRVLLTILASPVYILGALIGLLWFTFAWLGAALLLGIKEGKARHRIEME